MTNITSKLPQPENNNSSDAELDEAIFSFGNIQAELNYGQAKTALKTLVTSLDLTSQELSGLESEIADLETMLGKLEDMVVQIAAFGMVGRGKSSLQNALVGQPIFETGPLHGVTRVEQTVNWTISQEAMGTFKATFLSPDQSQIVLVDTPGLDEVDGETRAALAQKVAKQADLILFVIAGDMTKIEQVALSLLRTVGKPIILVFNKTDQYPINDRLAIYEKIRDDRVKELVSPQEIVMCAASPLVKTALVLGAKINNMTNISSKLPQPENNNSSDAELDEAIFSFGNIQAELNYGQAKTALKNLVSRLDLTSQEMSGLESEIADLETRAGIPLIPPGF